MLLNTFHRIKPFAIGVAILVLLFLNYATLDKTLTRVFGYKSGCCQPTSRDKRNQDNGKEMEPHHWSNKKKAPHLAVVICGDRFDEPMNMLKSAVLFTKSFLFIHAFADSKLLQDKVKAEIESWPEEYKTRLKYTVYDTSFPADLSCKNCEWKTLFAPCAAQRLFLADILKDVDSILYVDADALFLAPIEEIWSNLHKFNSTQFVGAVSVTEEANTGIYHAFHHTPFYGPTGPILLPVRLLCTMHSLIRDDIGESYGINSGVLLMNLTRMRSSSWLPSLSKVLFKYKKHLKTGDQDLINVFLHDHPEHAYLLSCDWNYHIQQCSICYQASQTGVAILHGFMHSFIDDKIQAFKAIYNVFNQFKLGTHNIKEDLIEKILRNIKKAKSKESQLDNECDRNPRRYTQRMEALIDQN